MEILVIVLALALLGAVIAVISGPLRAAAARRAAGERDGPLCGERAPRSASERDRTRGSGPSAERSELEAAREAKYREIRDAELDFRTGKLSREDYDAIDGALRAEALEILDRLARETGEESGEDVAAGGG